MSINGEIPNVTLLEDLLSEEDGDEATNNVRRLIKDRFEIEFNKLPFHTKDTDHLFESVCGDMAELLVENISPFKVGAVEVDGSMVIHLVNELISQIRSGGNRYWTFITIICPK